MNRYVVTLLLALAGYAAGAQSVYQPHEVDTPAEPPGGSGQLLLFMQHNLRLPPAADASGPKGRVFLSAVVGPDGRPTNVVVTRGLRPDLDREAARAFSLYRAWKPARKAGQAVAQHVSFSVSFPAQPLSSYQDGQRTVYSDKNARHVAPDADDVAYKIVTPIDTNGLPTGDAVVFEKKAAGWTEIFRNRFERRPLPASVTEPARLQLVHVDPQKQPVGMAYTLTTDGRLLSEQSYRAGQPTGQRVEYAPNGMVLAKEEATGEHISHMQWHPNGQLDRYELRPANTQSPAHYVAQWDSLGTQRVVEGTGTALLTGRVPSQKDTAQLVAFIETGPVTDGLKQGVWTGRYADGSYHYVETYDKGVCTGGKAITAGRDTVRYATNEEAPEFRGGMAGMGQFLSRNLRYPKEAQRKGEQGRVFVRFTVCTDGTLCDYEILKGVSPPINEEALRVVKEMNGKWQPGKLRGEPVRVKYNMPVTFQLAN